MSLIGVQIARQHAFKSADEVEDKAITIRPSSTSLFCVDSADREPNVFEISQYYSSPYDFGIQKNESLLNGFFSRIALTELVFPYYIPNINNYTNTITFRYDAGAATTITLTNGFYTPTALAAELETEIQAAGGTGVTVTYTETGRFVIDAQAGHTIAIFGSSYYAVAPNQNPALAAKNVFTLFNLIGGLGGGIWGADEEVLTSAVTRCRYTEYIDITCTQLTYNQNLKDSSTAPIVRDILARVYLECENDQPIPVNVIAGTNTNVENTVPGTYPFTIYRQYKNPKMIKWDKEQPIGNLRFQVFDSWGNLLSANNNEAGMENLRDNFLPNWRMTLLVSEN